jgi:peptide/nickel transport system permease protein
MAVTSEVVVDSEFETLTDKKPVGLVILDLMRRKPLGAAGALIVIAMFLMAVFADFLTHYDPVANSFASMTEAPSWAHWLGTSSIIGATTGLVLGVGSAYFGGRTDLIFQRIMDIFMAFPLIIMALAVVSIFGTGAQNVIIAITIPFIPRCARVVRSSALAIREVPYIDAARANGFSHARIILRHMVPNVMAPYLIMITSFVGQAILLEASLSYLGLGVQEPTPAWGLMLQGGAEEYALSAPWMAIFPGVAISLAVFGFNLFGDAVRDVLDPRLRSR